MATINHTEFHNAPEVQLQSNGLLKYSTLSDSELLSKVWERDTNYLKECGVLINELALRFELEVFGCC